MAQEPSSKDLLEAVKQQESGGRRYDKSGKLLEGPPTKYGTAKGEMQVLDMTNRDPGFGVKPAKDDSPDERARVGKDYLAAMTKRYGNTETGLIAYNWGPGNTDKWLKGGADPAKLPKETQNYVAKITASLGGTKVAKAAPIKVAKAAPIKVAAVKADVPERGTGIGLSQAQLLSQLGPSYQAAMAVSMLADEVEKEDKDEDAPSEAEKMLAEMSLKPAPAAEIDLGYQSPFPEIQAQAAPVARKPLPFLRPVRMAAGGLPFSPTASVRSSARKELDAIKAQYDAYAPKAAEYNTALEKYKTDVYSPYQAQVDAYNAALGKYNTENFTPYQAQVDAYNTALGKYKTDVYAPYETQVDSYNTALGKYKTDIYDPYEAAQKKYDAEYAAVFATPKPVSFVMSKQYRDLVARAPVAPAEFSGVAPTKPAEFSMTAPVAPAQFSGVAPTKPAEFAGQLPTAPAVSQEEYGAKMATARKDVANRQVALDVAMNPQAYGFNMAKLFAEGGEVSYFQDPMGAPSAPVTEDTLARGREFKAAEALQALKEVGTGAARNLKNILKGTTETPYNFFGAAADIGNMALTPLGLGSAEPFLGSAQLKRLATEEGIRLAPPTDPRDAGYYMMGELGASVVNPGPIAAKVGQTAEKAVAKGGKAVAKEMLRGIEGQGVLAPISPQDSIMYAVRNKATPFLMTKRPDTATDTFLSEMSKAEATAFREKYPDINFFDERALQGTEEYKNFIKPIDQPEYFVKYGITDYKDRIALKDDPILSGWFNKAIPSYFRKDFATPEDQLVRAADQGKLLHFEPKKGPRADESVAMEKQKDASVRNTREVEGFSIEGEAKTPYGKRVENTIDKAVYPVQAQDIGRESQVPPSLVKFLETNPEKRASELTPMTDKRLKLSELRKNMLRIRQIGPEYSAYGQPAEAVPKEFTLPDDLLPRFNLAEASNRVARFTRWEDDTRPRMATGALLTDSRITRDPIQNGKYMSVTLPDPVNHPEFKALITDVGCDGGWCTAQEQYALSYGSGKSQLHALVTNTKKARPIAQISVEEIGKGLDGNPTYSITDIKEKGDTENFLTNPALPAIQEQIKLLENQYGGFRGIHALDKLGMTEIPKTAPVWLSKSLPLSQALDLTKSFKEIRNEAIRLNAGSQYVIGKQNDTNNLLEEAAENLFGPQQRATGGMVERQVSTARYI